MKNQTEIESRKRELLNKYYNNEITNLDKLVDAAFDLGYSVCYKTYLTHD